MTPDHGENTALHEAAFAHLIDCDQRYTSSRRRIVEALATSERPMTVPEIVAQIPELPQSSAYRNLTVLQDVGVVTRIAGSDDNGRYELAEGLSGYHHHHLVCSGCGLIVDVPATSRIERALHAVAESAAAAHDFEITDHRIDLIGMCAVCRL